MVCLPFSCSRCTQSFAQPTDLKAHSKVHSVHRCSNCSKTFNRPFRLKAHLRSHTREKPFSCSQNVVTHRTTKIIWRNIWRCIWVRNHISVRSVESRLLCPGLWKDIWKFTHGKNRTVADIVNNYLSVQLHWKTFWDVTLAKSCIPAYGVLKHFLSREAYENTLVVRKIDSLDVLNVKSHMLISHTKSSPNNSCSGESIPVVHFVQKLSSTVAVWSRTWDLTHERNPAAAAFAPRRFSMSSHRRIHFRLHTRGETFQMWSV